MSPDEAPKRRRRKGREASEASGVTSASEALNAPEGTEGDEGSSSASEADVTSEPVTAPVSEVEDAEAVPSLQLEAEEASADAEAEGSTEDATVEEAGEAEAAPKPARRRRRGSGDAEAEKPAAPAPSRRRAKRDPSLPAPVVRAQAKYVRSSPRKARLVCDHIRGKTVDEARAILAHAPRAVARDWSKLLESAVANAEHNHELVGEDLYVKAVHADDGPTIKRFRPRAMGRATKIRKRTSHLTILLTPKDE
jgi:ribosomal protein L22